jgi:hypothetical protein
MVVFLSILLFGPVCKAQRTSLDLPVTSPSDAWNEVGASQLHRRTFEEDGDALATNWLGVEYELSGDF